MINLNRAQSDSQFIIDSLYCCWYLNALRVRKFKNNSQSMLLLKGVEKFGSNDSRFPLNLSKCLVINRFQYIVLHRVT